MSSPRREHAEPASQDPASGRPLWMVRRRRFLRNAACVKSRRGYLLWHDDLRSFIFVSLSGLFDGDVISRRSKLPDWLGKHREYPVLAGWSTFAHYVAIMRGKPFGRIEARPGLHRRVLPRTCPNDSAAMSLMNEREQKYGAH